jgi:hypothetical protein
LEPESANNNQYEIALRLISAPHCFTGIISTGHTDS